MAFLNTLLPQRHQVKELSFSHNEHLGSTQIDRRAVFDFNCTSPTGEHFIVEIQKAKISKFTPEERQGYENSLKYYWDMKNVIDTAAMDAELECVFAIELRDVLTGSLPRKQMRLVQA